MKQINIVSTKTSTKIKTHLSSLKKISLMFIGLCLAFNLANSYAQTTVSQALGAASSGRLSSVFPSAGFITVTKVKTLSTPKTITTNAPKITYDNYSTALSNAKYLSKQSDEEVSRASVSFKHANYIYLTTKNRLDALKSLEKRANELDKYSSNWKNNGQYESKLGELLITLDSLTFLSSTNRDLIQDKINLMYFTSNFSNQFHQLKQMVSIVKNKYSINYNSSIAPYEASKKNYGNAIDNAKNWREITQNLENSREYLAKINEQLDSATRKLLLSTQNPNTNTERNTENLLNDNNKGATDNALSNAISIGGNIIDNAAPLAPTDGSLSCVIN